MRSLGKYRLLEPVASGGMAEVYRAEVPGPEGFVKEVALKVVRGDHAEGSDFVRMFIQEARLASRLTHANIVQVFDFDRVEGRYLIAMEFVHGRTLRAVVDRCREFGLRLGVARAVFVASEVGKALAYAQRPPEAGGVAGIVHRDVSPHNVLVSFEGEVKLADFGIARVMNAAGLTDPGTVKGKLAYMAPEQARGERVDARADLFSLGVVLWELLAGRRLFARDTDAATLAALLGGAPLSPPSSWNEEVPPELDAAVMASLERDPERRTRSADEMVAALGAVLLRIARGPDDFTVGPLMRRLWPREATPPSARPSEITAARPPERTAVRVAPPEPTADPDAPTDTAEPPEAPAGPRRARRAAVPLAASLAASLAAGVAIWLGRAGAPPGSGPDLPAGGGLAAGAAGAPSEAPSPPAAALAPAGAARPGGPAGEAADGAPSARLEEAPAGTGLQVLARSERLRSLPLPRRESGEGILSLNATPWATVYVDGRRMGDTPLELRLPAGRYAVGLVHPKLRAARRTLEVRPGERTPWAAALGR